jgi:hypothetical protein
VVRFRLKKKPKSSPFITNEDVRKVVREELDLTLEQQKKLDDDEKKRLLIKKRIEGLPPQKRLKFLRYLKEKKGNKGHDKK